MRTTQLPTILTNWFSGRTDIKSLIVEKLNKFGEFPKPVYQAVVDISPELIDYYFFNCEDMSNEKICSNYVTILDELWNLASKKVPTDLVVGFIKNTPDFVKKLYGKKENIRLYFRSILKDEFKNKDYNQP